MPERQILSLDEFYRKALAAKQKTGPGIVAGSVEVMETLIAQVEPDPSNERRMTFTVATAETNRNDWKLNPQGWHLENYAKNPVMLWTHNDGSWLDSGSHGLPFAKAERTWLDRDFLKVRCLWVEKGDITGEAGELCESVLRLYRKGYLNAVSAGWIPLDWEFVEVESGWEIMCKEQELVEISFVPIPAEPNALREAASAGINVAPVRRWARAVLGEPRYLMALDHKPTQAEVASITKQFAEFYPGAKLLVHGPGEKIAALEDLAAVKQFTREEFDAQVDAVKSGRLTAGVSPRNVSTELADKDEAWSGPTLADFTDKLWTDLSDEEKRNIAGHFAWAAEMPPEAYGSLKLPHHRPSDGKVVWKGCTAAMSRLMQPNTSIPEDDRRKVYNHLAAHYRAFEEEPPEFESADTKLADLKIPVTSQVSVGTPVPEIDENASTSAAAGLSAPASSDAPRERLIPGSREWRTRQLARIDN